MNCDAIENIILRENKILETGIMKSQKNIRLVFLFLNKHLGKLKPCIKLTTTDLKGE